MKIILLAILLTIPTTVFSDTIKCFSGERTVYYREAINITYTGEIFIFEEKLSGNTVMYSGNCMVKFNS